MLNDDLLRVRTLRQELDDVRLHNNGYYARQYHTGSEKRAHEELQARVLEIRNALAELLDKVRQSDSLSLHSRARQGF